MEGFESSATKLLEEKSPNEGIHLYMRSILKRISPSVTFTIELPSRLSVDRAQLVHHLPVGFLFKKKIDIMQCWVSLSGWWVCVEMAL